MTQDQDPFAPIRADMEWYEKHKEALLQRDEGQYIAILNGRVIDADPSFHALAERVFGKLGYRSVFMPKVERQTSHVSLGSPRVISEHGTNGHQAPLNRS